MRYILATAKYMDVEKACRLGEEIAKKYNSDEIVPFPFDRIIVDETNLRISNSKKLPDNVSGVILFDKEKEKYLIAINEDKPKNRQYFSIAHELGHYFLHKEELRSEEIIIDDGDTGLISALYRLDDTKTTVLEKEANNFAASLLMPERLVAKAWTDLKDVDECAKIFEVSVVAMSIRLAKLNLLS